MAKRFVGIGECMIEMSGGVSGQYRLGFAGDTLNASWYARAGLGEDWQVDYVTALGDDIYSDQMIAFFDANGIGTSRIQRIVNARPGLYLIHQAHGDRHFTYWRDTAAARRLADDPERLDASLDGASLVYFSGITLGILTPDARAALLGALASARKKGARLAFDPNIRPALWPDEDALRDAITAAASISDIVMPTHTDEQPVFGDETPAATAQRYRDLGVAEVVVKDGAEPALVAYDEGHVLVGAEDNVDVIDATGAGDSFNGAYLAARLSGHAPLEAARAAHRTAATVIGHHGALVDFQFLG
ncbi:MAG TPA: sugar kinase [Devosiaceae bacterium]